MTRVEGWEWCRRGVNLYDDHLTWYESEGDVRYAGGAACDQTLDDFLERGPWVDGVPADVLGEVKDAVGTLVAKRGALPKSSDD